MVKLYEKAPEFCLEDYKGKRVCLKDFKGHWIVLYFYPKADTPGCTVEANEFNSLLKEFNKLGAIIIGISKDPITAIEKFVMKYGLNFYLLSDKEMKVLKKYGALAKQVKEGKERIKVLRNTYIINPEGKIVMIYEKVKARGHAEKVLKDLKELKERSKL